MLAGLMTPDNGRIAIDGTSVYDSATGLNVAPERRHVGYVFQDARLFPHMNVRRNLDYGARRKSGRAGSATGPGFDDVVDVLAIAPLLDRQPHLLSGGEKALSAIALLFAIFRYQPSPFCLLDEVDAALDDVNVGRFARLVGEFAQQTQFILVTHNKLSMEVADLIYGVTMEEPGVSKLMSLQLA